MMGGFCIVWKVPYQGGERDWVMRSAAAAEAEVVQGFPIIHSIIYLFIMGMMMNNFTSSRHKQRQRKRHRQVLVLGLGLGCEWIFAQTNQISLFDKGVFPIWQVMMGKKSQEYDSKVEKSLADKLGDWSKGWPGGETALNGWVRFIKCLFVSWTNGNLLLVVVCLYLLQAF